MGADVATYTSGCQYDDGIQYKGGFLAIVLISDGYTRRIVCSPQWQNCGQKYHVKDDTAIPQSLYGNQLCLDYQQKVKPILTGYWPPATDYFCIFVIFMETI